MGDLLSLYKKLTVKRDTMLRYRFARSGTQDGSIQWLNRI